MSLEFHEIEIGKLPLAAPQMNAPEAYIQLVPGAINDDGEVSDDELESLLRDFMAEFATFVERVLTVLPQPGN